MELAFPRVPFVWLETAASSDSVFLLKRDDLLASLIRAMRAASAAHSVQREEALDPAD